MISTEQRARDIKSFSNGKAVTRDASLDFFQELRKYRGRIVLSANGSQTSPVAEATFLCQILFLKFMAHCARYDGSFMLKLQVEHLRELPCPDLQKIPAPQKKRLLHILEKLGAQSNRKSAESHTLRDELDRIFLELLDYSKAEIEKIQPALRAALEQAILFRWVKTRTRLAKAQ